MKKSIRYIDTRTDIRGIFISPFHPTHLPSMILTVHSISHSLRLVKPFLQIFLTFSASFLPDFRLSCASIAARSEGKDDNWANKFNKTHKARATKQRQNRTTRRSRKKWKKFSKKRLTNRNQCGILFKHFSEGRETASFKVLKIFKKLLKNPLTNLLRCDIIIESRKSGRKRS